MEDIAVIEKIVRQQWLTATKDQIREELEARRHVGGMMANFCFNVWYDLTIPQRYRDKMFQMRQDWDAIDRVDIGTVKRRKVKP